MSVSLLSFPQRHAGLTLGSIMALGLLLCLGSGGDPSTHWGVSQIYPEIGVEPFAEARGLHLGIESGLDQQDRQPFLTTITLWVYHFFGHGSESHQLFSLIPYMFCIFAVTLLIAKKRGRIFGLIGGGWLALQPTFMAWSSVPTTVPLASFTILILVAIAGQPQRWAPWFSFVAGLLLSWGLSPMVMLVMPICWIEGLRREVSERWQPHGWALFVFAVLVLFGLQVAGMDPLTLAMAQSGLTQFNVVDVGVSLVMVDPGLVLVLTLALFVGFRSPQPRLRPLTGLIVTSLLPWVLAGKLPVFPLVVLLPSMIWLVIETFADRSRVKILNMDDSGKGLRESLLMFLICCVALAVFFISKEKVGEASRLASVCLAICIVGALLGMRAGFRSVLVAWVGTLCMISLLIPVNLNRVAHSTDRLKVARESLDRLIPSGEAVAGHWAHVLVMGTDRPAFQKLDQAQLRLVEGLEYRDNTLEQYQWGNQSISLFRVAGKPGCLFEEAVQQHALGDIDRARHSLSLILRKAPECSSAWERLGLILLNDGHEDLASECFFFALQDDVWRPVSHQQLARLYSKYGLFREARHHLEMSRGPDFESLPSSVANVSFPGRR